MTTQEQDSILEHAEVMWGRRPVDPDGYIKAKRDFRGTLCCGAGVKGVQHGLACRACYGSLDEETVTRVLYEERAIFDAVFGA